MTRLCFLVGLLSKRSVAHGNAVLLRLGWEKLFKALYLTLLPSVLG
jgi:hypothetical protein